ncbi:hypothetical protein [Burkholderia lata]|uniref:Uncharacterized protein n=1 Tax=Burkholderia lata (strain ATCC 17760 / DSM 23089 / LMG 22485 / NCIMB 9086 / R18194 / 383) TaxID=482957 RepID=A0A6P2GX36_BURL3|nr:hypothetical protein [Burkholderia lata]VWB08511.1 hypothetical protein BLA6863_00221 [Burkholderia lata]
MTTFWISAAVGLIIAAFVFAFATVYEQGRSDGARAETRRIINEYTLLPKTTEEGKQ